MKELGDLVALIVQVGTISIIFFKWLNYILWNSEGFQFSFTMNFIAVTPNLHTVSFECLNLISCNLERLVHSNYDLFHCGHYSFEWIFEIPYDSFGGHLKLGISINEPAELGEQQT